MATKKKMNEQAAETAKKQTFTKQQILLSEKFKNAKDALSVCLNDNKKYTIEQAQTILSEFMKGKV